MTTEIVPSTESRPSVVELTPAAQCFTNDAKLLWLVSKLEGLKLPPEEFRVVVGVKLRRGYVRGGSSYTLPALGLDREAIQVATVDGAITPTGSVSVTIVAYEALFTWARPRGSAVASDVGQVSIPVSWDATLLEWNRNEAAFRTKLRFLMTELMLASYDLDSYRDR